MAVNTHWNSWAATIATTPKRPVALGALKVGADVIELAVIPTGAIRLLQRQDRDLVASAAKAFTSRRKRLPIFSMNAGERIG